jgi:hypothetical protein
MDETQIKTRYGLILEGIFASVLAEAGLSYEHDVHYDPSCEKPDFLIPSATEPRAMIEVHQAGVRNSLQMKILRAFTAVAEVKAHFGDTITSINVIFGDPGKDFSSSPLSALSAIYDVSMAPSENAKLWPKWKVIEDGSLNAAAQDDVSTDASIKRLCKRHKVGIQAFAKVLRKLILTSKPRLELLPFWQLERRRLDALTTPPLSGEATYHKRMLLAAMYFDDKEFETLVKAAPSDKWPKQVVTQLLHTKLATIEEEIDGDKVEIDPLFAAFLKNAETPRVRSLCRDVLDTVPQMKWYFEDIRSLTRRRRMARSFLGALSEGQQAFATSFANHVLQNASHGIQHTRSWFCDLTEVLSGKGFNYFNRAIKAHKRYPLSLWSPFNNLALKWSAHERDPVYVSSVASIIAEILFTQCAIPSGSNDLEINRLANGLLNLRLRSAVKLRRLNPLIVVASGICADLGLSFERIQIPNLLFDLSEDSGVGIFSIFRVTNPDSGYSALFNAVAVHDGHGDDKSKEWGARRLATLYRMKRGEVRKSEYQEGIFVLDGEWKDKDVARLYRSGWNHVVRLADLEKTLRSVFGIKTAKRRTTANLTLIGVTADDEDFAMTVEGNTPQKLTKRRQSNGR